MTKQHLLLSLCFIIGFVAFYFGSQPKSVSHKLTHGLPWQIELNNHQSRVFGISPGVSTLEQAIATAGNEYELAILERFNQQGALEVYYSHFNAGPLQGKLILVVNIRNDLLELLKTNSSKQEFLDNGTKKFRLSQEQQLSIMHLPVRSITFVPTARLNPPMIEQRFGKATIKMATEENIEHFLYPKWGLDILINNEGKDFLQYLSLESFPALQAQLEANAKKHKQLSAD